MLNIRIDKEPILNRVGYLYDENRLVFNNEADESLSFFNIIFSQIPVTIIAELNFDCSFTVLYNDVFLLTLLKFMKNEIKIEGVFFSELTRPIQRKFEQYHVQISFIEHSQDKEEVASLIQNMKDLF